MTVPDGRPVLAASAEAWSELRHAEVAYVLRQAGVRVLHIKGPTVALWLYADGERPWGDVDVLVAPSDADAAVEALRSHGFTERFLGVTRHSTDDHAVTYVKADPELGSDEVDLHVRFEGIELEPQEAFELLWRRREPVLMAGIEAWFPDLTSRGLFALLNAARGGSSPKALRDLSRLAAAAAPDDWRELLQLASRLRAEPALRAGLELDPSAVEAVGPAVVAALPASVEWQLRASGGGRTALRLDELSRLRSGQRVARLLRWVLPPPAVVRMRDPQTPPGAGPLVLAYGRRWGQGLRALPGAAAEVRRLRRARDGS